MKKFILTGIFLSLSLSSFAEIKYKIVQPITFKNISTESWNKEYVAGEGIIEIYTNDLDEDSGKLLVIEYPDTFIISNKKKSIPLEKIIVPKADREFVFNVERRPIKIYAFLDRKKLDAGEDASIIEGEYTAKIPIVINEYSKINE
jgi:hypothetical protein